MTFGSQPLTDPNVRTPPSPRLGDPAITPELVADHGLSPDEYQLILGIMGREPTYTELGIFSAMWSEHCGYKNSKRLLTLLPTEAPWVIQGPGENAGVIDIGDGFALAFKIESHNHPSAIEPYQGAATGVGGILRDIFTMGARPIATLNSLRFGDLDQPRVRYLFGGVVKGVGDYGNCVGIPSMGGEVYFDRGYEGNPLVNAMCLGLMRREDLILGSAEGVGNTMMAVGARTGRDGIHGATFASEELSEDDDLSSRPRVQVGDPFTEKLLLEASLELIKSGHIVGIQDMGAAGLTSSAAEMAGRAGNGIDLEMSQIPVREAGMTPYEILLSESQERMLVAVEVGKEDHVRTILEKWELEAEVVGEVTDSGTFRVLENGVVVADIPAAPLTTECPTYEREGIESEEIAALRTQDLTEYKTSPQDLRSTILALLTSPNIASKQWIYEQYDTTVRGSSVERPGGDAGVVRIPGTNRGIAATTDCNGRYTYLNPRQGALGAVVEAARNLACVGAVPMAVTNNLNFGNPTKSHIYYQLREAVLGMRDACAFLETPVTGGNVSLFNETDGVAIYPTPVIGMVGLIEDLSHVTLHCFQNTGDVVILLGTNRDELGGSEYLYRLHDVVAGEPPAVNLQGERLLQQAVLHMIGKRLLTTAHDLAEGGLVAGLVESCLGRPEGRTRVGATIDFSDDLDDIPLLFSESHGRVLVACAADDVSTVLEVADRYEVPAQRIGMVGVSEDDLTIKTCSGEISLSTSELATAYFGAIPSIMDTAPTSPGE